MLDDLVDSSHSLACRELVKSQYTLPMFMGDVDGPRSPAASGRQMHSAELIKMCNGTEITRDVTLLACHVLPPVKLRSAMVLQLTDAGNIRQRQTHAEQNNTGPTTLFLGGPVIK